MRWQSSGKTQWPRDIFMLSPMPPTLRLALAMIVAGEQRCQATANQCLAMIWETSPDDRHAEQAGRQVYVVMSPEERYWLGRLAGTRKPVAV